MPPLTDALTRRLALANLVAQVGIVVTGGLVRLTGSGLGCSTWPMCEPGQFTPVFHEEMSFHPFVEFGNRTVTGILLVIAVALLWAVHREPVRSRPPVFRTLAWWVLGLIAVQAVIGGISVLVDLHPAVVGSHMYFSLALVALSAYLLARLGQPDGPATPPPAPLARTLGALAVTAAVMLVVGVITTGSGPHAGDADAPYRFALDPVAVTRIHSLAMWAFLALLGVAVTLSVRSGTGSRPFAWVIGIALAQGAVGYLQYFTGLPGALVLLHMFLAAALVVAVTVMLTRFWPRTPAPAQRNQGAWAGRSPA